MIFEEGKISYSINVELAKPWFSDPYVKYQLVKHYKYWDDPSYGNGGGEYRDGARVLVESIDKDVILALKHQLEEKFT